jgi:hypothetical protein
VGAFKVKIDPVTLNIREVSFGAEGVLGTGKGMHVSTQGRVACRTEMQTAGQAAGRLGIGSVSFGDEKLDLHTNRARDRHADETNPE